MVGRVGFAGHLAERVKRSSPKSMLALGGVSLLMLTACGGGDDQANGDATEPADATEPTETTEDPTPDQPATVEEFCASNPELTEADEERALDIGPTPAEEPEEVPMPYLEALEQDADYQEPTTDAPAENVPVPEFSALLCDQEAGHEAASALLSQWFEFYRYGELSGETDLLAQLHHQDCETCDTDVDDIDAVFAEGQWFIGEPITAELHMWQIGEDPDRPIGLTEVTVPEYTVALGGGEEESYEASGSTLGVEVAYDDAVGYWQIIGHREAAIGDDVFDNGGGSGAEGSDAADAPEVPDEARENSAEGALAALDHWLAAYDYTVATGDPESADEMLHADNPELSSFYDNFLNVYAEGGHVELLGESVVEDVEVYLSDVRTDNAAVIAGSLHEAGWDIYESDGSLALTEEGMQGDTVLHAMFYDDDAGHWQLAEFHIGEVQELLDESGISDAEPDLTR